jgi:hypothetical protein
MLNDCLIREQCHRHSKSASSGQMGQGTAASTIQTNAGRAFRGSTRRTRETTFGINKAMYKDGNEAVPVGR